MFLKVILYRSLVISIVLAALTSTVSMVINTLEAQTYIINDAKFEQAVRESDNKPMVQYIEKAKSGRSIIDRMLSTFSYPGFWIFWFKAFIYVVIPVFLGSLSIIFWNNKRPLQNRGR